MANPNNTRQTPLNSQKDSEARTNSQKPDSRVFDSSEQKDQRSSLNQSDRDSQVSNNRQSSPGKRS